MTSLPKTLQKLLLAAALLSLSGVSSIRAADTPAGLSPYEQAVAQYVAAAESEVTSFRDELAKLEKAGTKADLAPVRESIAECAKLVERLKSAGPRRFDDTKREYEQARAKLREQLAAARKV